MTWLLKLKASVVFITTCLICGAGIAVGANERALPKILNVQDKEDLKRLEIYLERIKTLRGGFLQVSSDGSVATGRVFLSRPGRMRFEYDPPETILLISDGLFFMFIDKFSEQVTHVFLKSTPINFLVRENVELGGDVTVTKIERTPAVLRVTIQNTEEPENGSITLVFSDKPLTLRKWIVIDPQNIETSVTLTGVQTGIELNPELFVFRKKPSWDK